MMRFQVSLCLSMFLVGFLFLNAEEPEKQIGNPELRGWELTFVDEFDGERLDYDKWIPKDPWEVERNEELQGYWIKAFHPEGGILKIRCEKEASFYDGEKREYRSGMMATNRTFNQQFGRFEIRCRIPKGQGLWPAFWLLPESMGWPPEIDVLEIVSEEPNKLHMTNHWPKPSNPSEESDYNTTHFNGPDFSEMFHIFAIEWEAEEIRWYVDGIQRHSSKNEVPQEPMYMLVNLAVGGWAKEPDESTVFPADFEVDYVKVWKR
jgi:beta-glucanase (GH16 family)